MLRVGRTLGIGEIIMVSSTGLEGCSVAKYSWEGRI